jgi:glutamine amidotransferase
MTARVSVVDYGVGNLLSVTRALAECGAEVDLTGDAVRIAAAERVVLPGVGAFGQCVERLRERGLDEAVLRFVATGRPLLGICVGMQMLLSRGEEFGEHAGLGLIDGTVRLVPRTTKGNRVRKVPHIGWFPLQSPEAAGAGSWAETPLASSSAGTDVYFLHSYEARPDDPDAVLAEYPVAETAICAAIARDNVFGTQFHPEKSGEAGLAILRTYLSL